MHEISICGGVYPAHLEVDDARPGLFHVGFTIPRLDIGDFNYAPFIISAQFRQLVTWGITPGFGVKTMSFGGGIWDFKMQALVRCRMPVDGGGHCGRVVAHVGDHDPLPRESDLLAERALGLERAG